LRFGPLVYLLPFYHPLRLIEEICMLDQLSRGRLEFGLGRGVSPIESRLYGNDPAQAQRQFEEAMEVVFAGLRGGDLTFEGEFYSYRDVPMTLEPVQYPHPPLWYGLHSPESAERAARKGYNMVSLDGIDLARPTAARYREVWESIATAGAPEPKIGLCRFIVVADTDAEALALARRAYPVWFTSFNWLWRRENMSPTVDNKPGDFDASAAEGRGIAGSPETVRRLLDEQLSTSDYNYLIGQFAFGDLSRAEVLHSIDLFAGHVMPALREREGVPARL